MTRPNARNKLGSPPKDGAPVPGAGGEFPSWKDRYAVGKALRQSCPRESHSA